MNTQKVEGVNRAIRTTVAKNVTYLRNFGSRVITALHNVNHGPGKSITGLCKALGCPIISSSQVSRSLGNNQLKNEKQKSYKNLENTKKPGVKRGMKCLICMQDNKSIESVKKFYFIVWRGVTRRETEGSKRTIQFDFDINLVENVSN